MKSEVIYRSNSVTEVVRNASSQIASIMAARFYKTGMGKAVKSMCNEMNVTISQFLHILHTCMSFTALVIVDAGLFVTFLLFIWFMASAIQCNFTLDK